MYVNVLMQLSAQETNCTKSPECSNGQAYACELTVSNGMAWGIWGFKDMCPSGTFASGFSLKVKRPIGAGDDTALNGIRLHCVSLSKGPSDSQKNTTIESDVGNWGEWTDIQWCHSGVLKSFQLRVESPQGDKDDTAANNIRFTCTGGDVLDGDGTNWGKWGIWSPKCLGEGICGIQTRVEPQRGSGDNTALNDVRMFCCD
ncbi:hypothetical protein PO909_004088 [Leuciscus waleckii]